MKEVQVGDDLQHAIKEYVDEVLMNYKKNHRGQCKRAFVALYFYDGSFDNIFSVIVPHERLFCGCCGTNIHKEYMWCDVKRERG
jgi:hypothetical protein